MQTTWNSIPTELLDKFFSYFDLDKPTDVKTLFECIKTCRNWKPVAEKFAYSRIHLDHLQNKQIYESNEAFKTRLILWLHSIECDKRYDHVKCVDLGSYISNRSILEGCCRAFPRLEEIETSQVVACETFFNNLLVILKQSELSYLKVIPKPKDDKALPVYVDCILFLRDSVTDLLLGDRPNLYSAKICEKSYTILEKELSTFPAITHLNIVRQSSQGIECLDHIIQSCKKLENVRMFVTSGAVIGYSPPLIVDISSVLPRPQIKRLDIRVAINSEQSLHKYPNLENMLCIATTNTDQLITYPSSALCHFFLFCAKIRTFRFDITTPVPVSTQALYEYWSSTPNKQQIMTICRMNIDDFEDDGCISFGVTKNEVEICCSEVSWPIESSLENQFSILKKCGSFTILNADYCDDEWEDNESEDYEMFKGDCINSIIKYCPKLQCLDIENISFEGRNNYNIYNNGEYTTNSSVKKLTLRSCEASEWILSKLINRFTSLDTLKLDEHLFHVCDINVRCPARQITIDASCCDLKQFYICEDIHYPDDDEVENLCVFISVERHGLETKFFVSFNSDNESGLSECSQEQFNTHDQSKSNLAFYLKFKSIKTFTVVVCEETFEVTF